jgi:peroxiredoxin
MNKILLTLFLSLFTFLYASEEAPTFNLTTINDKNITVSQIQISERDTGLEFKEFKGKAVLLALWGHRCPPCLKEIPEFIKLTNNHKDDLEIVAIEAQLHPANKVKEFANEHGMNYNVVAGINHDDFLYYIATKAGYTDGVPLPLLIAINKEGQVEDIHAGLVHEDELEMLVKELNE